jgi:hypothetical protein
MDPVQLNSLIVAVASAAIAAGGAAQAVVSPSPVGASPANARAKRTKHGTLDATPRVRMS